MQQNRAFSTSLPVKIVPQRYGRRGRRHTSRFYFLGELEKDDTPWNDDVIVNKTAVTFKIDTGADVTVVPESLHKTSKWPNPTPTKMQIRTASGSPLHVVGTFDAQLQYQETRSKQQIYVVRGLQRSLLGRPAIRALNILQRLHEIESSIDIHREFPKLFTGLGLFPGEYRIRLKEGANAFALTTPRRVPLPLRKPVREELDRMPESGVISKVDRPTEWCAGMVVAPKSGQRVRICVDLSRLNKYVRRERLMLPSVEPTLAQLHGAKCFSKLDANS
eukprot:m.259498 g.259498  ORF g.259498 m.259498 type:complete len:276 (+) comp40422_c0_seq1:1730-2557(+)